MAVSFPGARVKVASSDGGCVDPFDSKTVVTSFTVCESSYSLIIWVFTCTVADEELTEGVVTNMPPPATLFAKTASVIWRRSVT